MYVGWDGREYEDAEMDNMRHNAAAQRSPALQTDMQHAERVTNLVGDARFHDGIQAAMTRLRWMAGRAEERREYTAVHVLLCAVEQLYELADAAYERKRESEQDYAAHMTAYMQRLADELIDGSTVPLVVIG